MTSEQAVKKALEHVADLIASKDLVSAQDVLNYLNGYLRKEIEKGTVQS